MGPLVSEEQFARVTGYIESGKKEGANLGREDVSVARTNGGADVFGLAGFFRDDDLISHDGFVSKVNSTAV